MQGRRKEEGNGLATPARWPRTFRVQREVVPLDPVPAVRSGGWKEFRRRVPAQWKVKTFAPPALMTVFFVAYFLVLKNPLFPVTTMPLVAADAWIAFAPWSLPLYVSLWIYLLLAFALLSEREEMVAYGEGVVGLAVTGLGIFLFFPTAVPSPAIDWENHPEFQFLKSIDATGNACPSLHVAFAIFTALWLGRVLGKLGSPGWLRWSNWIWCVGIVYSTMATRQHVALDVVAGAVLGAVGGTLSLGAAARDDGG
jgi:membrane-associated phospholipid phosphatase